MKRFILNIVMMAGMLFCINGVLDYYTSQRLMHCQTKQFVGWSDITQHQLNSDLVVVGASRVLRSFDPAILDSILGLNTYNMGMDGSFINRQVVKYNVFDHYQNKKPDFIIVNVDFFTLGWTVGFEREQFFPYMWDAYVREQILIVEPFNMAELYIPIYRYTTYKGLFEILIESHYNRGMYKGYDAIDRAWDGTEYEKIKNLHFTYDERSLEMFETFLIARKNDDIQVIFCYAPIYAGVMGKLDNIQDVYQTYHTLAEKYDIPILDYTYSEMCSDTTYFYNAVHLNKQGAELFTTQLANDLLEMGIIK